MDVKAIILTIKDGVPHVHFITTETEEQMRKEVAPIKGVELLYAYGGKAVGFRKEMVQLFAEIYKTYKQMEDPWPWTFLHIQQMLTKETV